MSLSFLSLVLSTVAAIRIRTSRQPTYPLFAIDSVGSTDGNPLTDEDASVIVKSFSLIQTKFNDSDIATLQKAAAAAGSEKVFEGPVKYIDTNVAFWNEVAQKDGNYLGVSFYLTGTLMNDHINQKDSSVRVKLGVNRSLIPASPADDSKPPVFLRINDELLKITAVTSSNDDGEQTFNVERGFASTTPQAHNKDDSVYAPVYKAGGYPYGPSRTQFTLDPATAFAADRLSNWTVEVFQHGYSGSWFDCFSGIQYDAVDVKGKKLDLPINTTDPTVGLLWDFENNQPYTRVSLVEAHHEQLSKVIIASKSSTGIYPTLIANNVALSYWPELGGARSLLEPWNPPKSIQPPFETKPLNGYCLEQFAGMEQMIKPNPYADGCPPASDLKMVINTPIRWKLNVEILMDAAQRGLPVLPIMAQAGCKSVLLEAMSADDRDSFERFAYASFLMGVQAPQGSGKNSSIKLGLNAYYIDEDGKRYANVHDRYFYDLGAPTQFAPGPDSDFFLIEDKLSYRRAFENGVIVVNPSHKNQTDIDLQGEYVNPEDDPTKKISSIDLNSGTAAILLKDASYI